MELLKKMCSIHAPSGDESAMSNFLLDYIKKNQSKWKVKPKVFHGKGFQDCIVLVFGKPRTAIFAHIDSIGFTVRYNKQLIKLGGPKIENGYKLVGQDSKGKIECNLQVDKKTEQPTYKFNREIDRGTTLTFKPNWRETKEFVQCCYMDDRLGVWNALQIAETLQDGIIAFSCWEETGGGSVEYLIKFIYEKYNVAQAIISDITWVTEGVHHHKGVAITMRDSAIPRRSYINKILALADKSKIPYQREVEGSGGSDGNIIHRSPYPIDWCFIGAPEENVHTPDEKVSKANIKAMVSMYKYLMEKL